MLCIQTEKISTLWLQKQIWKYAKISNIRMERQEFQDLIVQILRRKRIKIKVI